MDFLLQQASMALVKTIMSLDAYLSFVPYSSTYTNRGAETFDISPISVLARQVMGDVLTFLYLAEAKLSEEEKSFGPLFGPITAVRNGSKAKHSLMRHILILLRPKQCVVRLVKRSNRIRCLLALKKVIEDAFSKVRWARFYMTTRFSKDAAFKQALRRAEKDSFEFCAFHELFICNDE
jgi:hypothetical protein